MHRNVYVPPTDEQLLFASAVVASVCKKNDVTISRVMSRCRTEHIAELRAVAIYLIRRYIPDISTTDIGLIFQRDHSTVISACKRVERLPHLHEWAIKEQNAIQHLI